MEHNLKPLPLQTHGQIKERREGREKKKTQTSASQWGLAETHAVPSAWLTTEYRMKCLWLAGPGHVSGALWQLKCSGCLITRQGQPEAPSEHGPLALPLAAETKRPSNYRSSVGVDVVCEWVGVRVCV